MYCTFVPDARSFYTHAPENFPQLRAEVLLEASMQAKKPGHGLLDKQPRLPGSQPDDLDAAINSDAAGSMFELTTLDLDAELEGAMADVNPDDDDSNSESTASESDSDEVNTDDEAAAGMDEEEAELVIGGDASPVNLAALKLHFSWLCELPYAFDDVIRAFLFFRNSHFGQMR